MNESISDEAVKQTREVLTGHGDQGVMRAGNKGNRKRALCHW